MGAKLSLRRWWLVVAGLLTIASWSLTPTSALGQYGSPQVTASISTDEVEVGEPFTVELVAMVEGPEVPTAPHLYAPGGFEVSGPRVSTRIATRWGTGSQSTTRGIGATWQLVAQRPGSYVIPAPTVDIGGQQITAGRSMRVTVVPATGGRRRSRPSRPSPFGTSPFGPPGGTFSFPFTFRFGGSPFDDDFFLDDRDLLDDDGRKLSMKREPERYVFLRAIADKKQAVVGEQITLSFYAYYRVSFEMRDRHEAPLADFLRVAMLTSPGTHPPVTTRVGGMRYHARLLDRMAIFPLRSGQLHTGSLTASFSGRRLGKSIHRASNDIVIEVREPPTDQRPPGYRIGDVGRYRLSASVQPREIDAGGSVAVLVRLEGTGNLPHSLAVPERTGIEWLEPEKKGEVTVSGGRVGGWRTFGYVVRLREPGKRYLGRIELPYYDAERQEYGVAEAELGDVLVRDVPTAAPAGSGTPAADLGGADEADPFASIGAARLSLGAFDAPDDEGLEPRALVALVVAPPLGVLLVGGLRRAARRLARRRAAKRADAGALAQRALGELKRAGDPKAQAGAAERAIHHALEAATGLKTRGWLLAELPAALEQRGLSNETATEVHALLSRCSAVRFEPTADEQAAQDLRQRAARLVRQLGKNGNRNGRRVKSNTAPPETPAAGSAATAEPSAATTERRRLGKPRGSHRDRDRA